MPDASTKSYSLSEIAQIIGVDESQLHRYAHKGLINPELSNERTARFTEVDCARLKIIKRADELGYSLEGIFNLIGHPDEVLNTDDDVAACERFAMGKYKQIYDELYHCEPLEQMNKQCDLRLLISYIKHLKELRKKTSPNEQPVKAEPQNRPLSTVNGNQIPSRGPQEAPISSPRVQRYSVERLWDYVNKGKQLGKNAHANSQPHEPKPQIPPLAEVQDGQASSGKLQKASLSLSTVRSYLNAKPWRAQFERLLIQIQHLRSAGAKVAAKVWVSIGLFIMILAVPGYYIFFQNANDTPKPPATESRSHTQTDAKLNAPDRQPTAKPSPEAAHQAAVQQPETVPVQSDKKPSSNQRADEMAPGRQSEGADAKATAAAEKTTPHREQIESDNVRQPESNVAVVRQSKEIAPAAETQLTESKPIALIQVRDLSLWHDALKNIYRADFTILKNETANNQESITGYVFVYLETGDDTVDGKGLLMPAGELKSGKPAQIQQGVRFSIRNSKPMSVSAVATVQPSDITSGKVMVFSPEGDTLLEKSFNEPIEPFFSASEERTVPPEPSSMPPAPSTPITPAAPESQSADLQRAEESIPTDIPSVQPPLESEAVSGSEGQPEKADSASSGSEAPPQALGEKRVTSKKVQPVAKIHRTDNPEAAVWEQKSYDAAVKGNFDQAVADATQAIKLDPGRVNPYINRSWAYIEKNLLELAIQDCRTALSIDPQNAFAYNNRGLAYQHKGLMAKAKSDYRNACDLGLNLGCQNLDAIFNQARIAELIDQSQSAFQTQDWDGVIRAATEVINLDPQNAVAYANRSAAYAQKNFLNKALKDSNEAIKYNPEFALAFNNRGYVLELLGNNRTASADYLKSCNLGLDLGCKNFERLSQIR